MAAFAEAGMFLMPGRFPEFLKSRSVLIERIGGEDGALFEPVRQTGTVWSQATGTVCQASNARYLAMALANDNVAAIIADATLANGASADFKKPVIFSSAPEALFLDAHLARLHEGEDHPFEPGIDPKAQISPHAVIEGPVRIGQGSVIGPHATVIGPAVIENDVCVEPNAVIGANGLYAKRVDGRLINMPHFGGVHIAADATVLSGAIVVKSAYFGSWTSIGQRAVVGVHTNIGHDAAVGEESVISSHVVVAGRARIGQRCWIGASASIGNGLSIGNDASIKIGAIVIADVAEGQTVSGNFALDHRRNLLRHARVVAAGRSQ